MPAGASISGSSNALDGLGGDERQVDRQDQDRLRAAGDDVGSCLGEARVEAAGSLAKGPGAELGCAGQDLGVGADDQDVVEPIDGQGGRDGPCQEALDEVMPLLGIERLAEPRLGALEGADRDDRRDPHRGWPGAGRDTRELEDVAGEPGTAGVVGHDGVDDERPVARGPRSRVRARRRACRARRRVATPR